MKTPNPGDKLDKKQVFDWILKNLNKANTNSKDNYAQLCDLFDVSFGDVIDCKIKYNPEKKWFVSKVLDIDNKAGTFFVHYQGWLAKYDAHILLDNFLS